ncbi:E3 ubiquitin-protein ligase MARCHF9, partial [Tachysurus ichikawai]
MFKNRIRMFFNELKLLVFMRSGPRQPGVVAGTSMRGLGAMGGCGWRAFSRCTGDHDHDAEEYYGSDAGARRSTAAAGLDELDARMHASADSLSLSSGTRTPQCRICFQGPEQ